MRTFVPTILVALLFGAHTLIVNAQGTSPANKSAPAMGEQGKESSSKAAAKKSSKAKEKQAKDTKGSSPAPSSTGTSK